MKYIKHYSENPKWLDARLFAPDPNSAARFGVLFEYCGSVFEGYAFAMPVNNYSEIEWHNTECDNSNPLDGKVLYWHQQLKRLDLNA